MKSFALFATLLAAISSTLAHYTFPSLIVGGTTTTAWEYVRETNNYVSQDPVTNVNLTDIRCYTSTTNAISSTATVAAGATIGFACDNTMYHPSVVNVYMAKAPSNVSAWDGSGTVWFKVYQITAVTNGGTSITFPAEGQSTVNFTIPKNLPTGQYLVRVENIAIHAASTYGGAQFYARPFPLACGQVSVTGGGSGTPGPLVAFPGAYTGYEPGILINIYSPIPATYTQPGPAVWTG
ncbi:glycoside hydrolase family 61 protein [Jaapia argillacea MUCL 33604]|uniref:lytic cellulose monooxygenase (C4-dehydrogenating) n=1 Tax=Jaapia argillacea MUCL 33604 TaxID=933084 RepID=A0A067PN21_9AGAM|nr:glycoside hydrolase family 61 protein [Jaapia argillacea MUCL 33604]